MTPIMEGPSASRSRVFISYRHEGEAALAAGRLAEDLRGRFGPDRVFQDFSCIAPGADFEDALQQGLETCAALLVVIGPQWLTAVDKKARRRLHLPDDWVRREVAEGLKQKDVRVFPVLLDAEMPDKEELPDDLKSLTKRQAFPLTARHWPNDVATLVEFLKEVPGLAARGAALGAPPVQHATGAPAPGSSGLGLDRPAREIPPLTPALPQGPGPSDGQHPSPPRVGWKRALVAVAAVGIAIVVLVWTRSCWMGGGSTTVPSTPTAEPTPTPPPTASPSGSRRVVINGPRPLYAGFRTGDVFQECPECPEMVAIVPEQKGFAIGTPKSEAQRGPDETPFGPIRFASPFAIGRLEVTRGQFAAGDVKRGPGCHVWSPGNWRWDDRASSDEPGFRQSPVHPVVCVSWDEVQGFIGWLNRRPSLEARGTYRLPSEAEWEYAARAGATTLRHWGIEPEKACRSANVADRTAKSTLPIAETIHDCSDGFVYTSPVGHFEPNAFGVYDTIGNVWEWTQDCYAEKYDERIRDGSAFETAYCGRRVLRGGCWASGPADARVARRNQYQPGVRESLVGFRLARTLLRAES
jgi:formylglycine-generating enzyme